MILVQHYKPFGAICLLYSLISFSSCKQLSQSITDTFEGRPEENTNPQPNPIFDLMKGQQDYLSDTAWLQKAEKEFRSLPDFRNKKAMLYDKVYFYGDGRIRLKVQDFENPDYINEYWYKEEMWGQPEPFRLSTRKTEAIPEHLFPLDSFSFLTAHKIWKNYNEKASIKKAEPTNYVYCIFRKDDRFSWWYPARIAGARATWKIWFDRGGDVMVFEKR